MYTIRATSSRTSCDITIKALVKKYTVCVLFVESSYYTVQITIPAQEKHTEGCVYTPKTNTSIVIITLLFVFHKAAKNFKTVIECLYKEINIVCFFDRILGN